MLHTLNLCSAIFQLYLQKFVRKNKNRLEFLLDLPNSTLPPLLHPHLYATRPSNLSVGKGSWVSLISVGTLFV